MKNGLKVMQLAKEPSSLKTLMQKSQKFYFLNFKFTEAKFLHNCFSHNLIVYNTI